MMATSPTNSSGASNTSMMKEYLRKQLKYWVENFRDDMLPRDFGTKSFNRCTITLHKIELKIHKVGASLQVPKPLLVTRAYCSEVVIKVPSWTAAEKFVQEPLSLRVADLFIDIKSATDCDDAYREAYDARVRAAVMEPDPLGSIASWYAFSTILSERMELVAGNIYVKVFAHGVSRIRVELANFHSRTTNAMWQDMRDLTHCVDRSPDGLLKTRFKFVSFSCSVLLTQSAEGNEAHRPKTPPPPLKILHDHAVTLRMTLFGHRGSKNESWETLSQVIDVNLHALKFDYDVAELLQIYDVYTTVRGWLRDAAEHERAAVAAGAGLNPSMLLLQAHQLQRSAVLPPSADTNANSEASFALQLTFRFSADATLRVVSERLGKQHIDVALQHAAVNLIVHHDHARELQVTVHEALVRFQDRVVLYIKPARDVMQLKQLRESVFVKWHVQTLTCCIEDDLALLLNEAYHAHNEKTQSAFIKCGTCLQQIHLESIESHVCSAVTTRSPATSSASMTSPRHRSQSSSVESARTASSGRDNAHSSDAATASVLDSSTMPRVRLVFALDELELRVDSHLFNNVQQLMRSANAKSSRELADRTFTVHMNDLSVTTESKEFAGDAVFVPVLPLAFQMLECTLQGCGCIRKQPELHTARPRWPERVFVELARLKCAAAHAKVLRESHREGQETKTSASSAVESFVLAETIRLRTSFSDGTRICANCHPQLSAHASVGRVRCQLDDTALGFLQRTYRDASRSHAPAFVAAQTLFLAVLEVRAIEFTLLQSATVALARLKHLFKHVSVVGDNQLGYLALQSSLDFRSLLNSQDIMNANKRVVAAASVITNFVKSKQQQLESEVVGLATQSKESAARLVLPHYSACKKILGLDSPTASGAKASSKHHEVRSVDVDVSTLKRNGSASSSSRSLTAEPTESAETLVTEHPASARVSRDRDDSLGGRSGSARREDSSRSLGNDHYTEDQPPSTTGEEDAAMARTTDANDRSVGGSSDEAADADAADEQCESEDETMAASHDFDDKHQSYIEPEHGLSDALLESLPSLVRVLVQVDEHRLRVPINPREKVGFLCREVVRRFNELFATHASGCISHVTLQDARGGVFAPTDIVGFVYATESDVLFALPKRADDDVRCVVHIEPSSGRPQQPRSSLGGAPASRRRTTARAARGSKTAKALGCKFTRCSQLPLPLAIALLANESERDLLRCVLSEGSYGAAGGGHANEWPELALNASFLDPSNVLSVEVRWFGQCLEVTNADAFVLCLQQLGLCTARASSKYVGKILRDRLKMDSKSPFIRAACLRSAGDFDIDDDNDDEDENDSDSRERNAPRASSAAESPAKRDQGCSAAVRAAVSYESLKEIVQDDYGVYLSSSTSD